MRTVKLITFGLAAAILMAGCQSFGPTWVAVTSKDKFTDVVTKMVTVGSVPSRNFLITQSLHYYPFVGVRNGEIYVGVRSGGIYRIPTGTVQIRIDNNKAWTISPEETPVYLIPSTPTTHINVPNIDIAKMQKEMALNTTKQFSPYTATTGAKAKSILKEMLAGKIIICRTVGFNQAASTTSETVIDASFINALREIGITPDKL